jgi:hypothetical protein
VLVQPLDEFDTRSFCLFLFLLFIHNYLKPSFFILFLINHLTLRCFKDGLKQRNILKHRIIIVYRPKENFDDY